MKSMKTAPNWHTWQCVLCRVRGSGPTLDWAVRRFEHHYMTKHRDTS